MLLFWRDVATYRPTPSPGPIPIGIPPRYPQNSFHSEVLCCPAVRASIRPHTYKDDCLKTKKPDVKKPDANSKGVLPTFPSQYALYVL